MAGPNEVDFLICISLNVPFAYIRCPQTHVRKEHHFPHPRNGVLSVHRKKYYTLLSALISPQRSKKNLFLSLEFIKNFSVRVYIHINFI